MSCCLTAEFPPLNFFSNELSKGGGKRNLFESHLIHFFIWKRQESSAGALNYEMERKNVLITALPCDEVELSCDEF